MTNVENFRSIARRTGYERMPFDFNMCPSLAEKFRDYVRRNNLDIPESIIRVPGLDPKSADRETFLKYYDHGFKEGTDIDCYGVAHEPGSAAAFHMTKMYHPMEHFDSVEQVLAYPFPDYTNADPIPQQEAVKQAHQRDLPVIGNLGNAVWEPAWYMRGMENLMMDMMTEDPIAEILLNRVTDISCLQAESFARSGADAIFMGDDVGMQRTILMSESLYCTWLKPRLAKVIRAARAINPDILIIYHSCGFVTPLIPHLIDAGIDVLNPVQPECMDFGEIHSQFGDCLSFHGTIGTQTTMPFGTPDEVRRKVFENLEIAGEKGGLFVAPTHLLEPEVPVENVAAYIKACQDFK
ncbi:MAG: uroporphyrinogen decarboxylase family protein [Candidatus Merdivicinus sp.]